LHKYFVLSDLRQEQRASLEQGVWACGKRVEIGSTFTCPARSVFGREWRPPTGISAEKPL